MKILIESPFSLNDEAKKSIEEKVSRLEKYSDKITAADVFFKLDDGKAPDSVTAKVQLRLPGPELFAEETKPDYMEALVAATNQVKRQLLKRKDSQTDHYR